MRLVASTMLLRPMRDLEFALQLDVPRVTAKQWLERLADDGLVIKTGRRNRYVYRR